MTRLHELCDACGLSTAPLRDAGYELKAAQREYSARSRAALKPVLQNTCIGGMVAGVVSLVLLHATGHPEHLALMAGVVVQAWREMFKSEAL